MKFASPLGDIQQAGAPETVAKSVTPCLLSVGDYKRLDTSLHFIIINLHTELTPQVNARYDMNSLTFTMLYAHRLVTETPSKKLFRLPPPGKMC